MYSKTIETIRIEDFIKYPVWTYINSDKKSELLIKPIKNIPIENTSGKIIGVNGKLNNGKPVFLLIGNYSYGNDNLNKHFITISLWINKSWFQLARYHDIDYTENGPKKLCTLLNLQYDEIFPIKYCLKAIIKNEQNERKYEEPDKKLTRQELIALSLE